MFKLPKKYFFLFLFILLFLSVKSGLAANPQDEFYDNSVQKWNRDQDLARDEAGQTGSKKWYSQPARFVHLTDSLHAFNQSLGCYRIDDPSKCNQQSTVMGKVAFIIGDVYAHPPASGIEYAYNLMENSGFLAKPAYAQGIGFAGLSPLLPLWKITRNIAYAAVILIMIVIGFMVIFRAKIDPKTVISVQAAIPKIVITLLLITFSYPIAGFMVDLMYLSIGILVSMLAGGFEQAGRTSEMQTYFLTADAGDLFKTVFSGGFSTLDDFFNRNFTAYIGQGAAVSVVSQILGASWWSLLIGGGAIPALFILILFLGLLFTFIRILMLLLNSYIQLLIGVVIGPLQILFEAVPGRSAFAPWLMNIVANLVVFPTTVGVLMFAEFLAQLNTDTSSLFGPPFTAIPSRGAFSAFLGLGVMFLAPTLIATVKKAFNPKPVLPISAGTAFAPLTGGAQTAMGAASQFYYLKQTLAGMPFLGGKKEH